MSKPTDIDNDKVTSVAITVDEAMTAAAFARDEGESYPAVLATPMMIGEMERAAAAQLTPILGEGELSVGVKIDIVHTAPTPVGSKVTSHARFVGREEALFWFEVWSEDEAGAIGKGRHARAIVNSQAIVERAAKRKRAR